MGAVDLVVQVESPGSVAAGLQRVGRAGHQVGAVSRGRFFPKHRADLVETAVVVQRMLDGRIESTRFVRNPLDVLAQHVVAMCALDEWDVTAMLGVLRGAAPFGELSEQLFRATLDLLDGRYPSEEFAELRPRVVWDRTDDTVRGRKGAQRLAVTNAGTIPDRGLFGVFLPDGTRVGELDEEMVYESRVGETFLLGATTWRIEDITFERVVVTPAPGVPGRMPFWHGDGPGRPVELGAAVGEFVRTIRELPEAEAVQRLRDRHRLDALAARNLLAYLDDQAAATGAVPDDRTIVVERFRDEIGDWRICVLTPFGARVHAPWAMAVRGRLERRTGLDVEIMWSDDGIICRLPESEDDLPVDELMIEPAEIVEAVVSTLPETAMFASRFREVSARALLLPRRRVDRRTPLWQQRQRAANLLAVASRYPTFPMLLETTRECVNDVFDVTALTDLMTRVADRRIRVVVVETEVASPFAASLLYEWIAVYMYEGDAPLAERRAAALGLDRSLLRDLLGTEELRSLLDLDVIRAVQADLQHLTEARRARDLDEVHDLLRVLGPLDRTGIGERSALTSEDLDGALAELVVTRRAIAVRVAGDDRWADAADAARLRDALGVALPTGLPAAFTDPVEGAVSSLVERFARTHGPFVVADVVASLGLPVDVVGSVLAELDGAGRLLRGEFIPGGSGVEWCDPDVLRSIRRRTLAGLRNEIEAVEPDVLARFMSSWQRVGSAGRGRDALLDVVGQLAGAPLVASMLDDDIIAARVDRTRPSDLDELCTSGDLVWIGAGAVGARDGRVRLVFRSDRALLASIVASGEGAPADGAETTRSPHHDLIRSHLADRGAAFWDDLVLAAQQAGLAYDEPTVGAALWDLVWAGEVTNDSLAPLRAYLAARGGGRGAVSVGRPRTMRRRTGTPPVAAGRWSLISSLLGTAVSPTVQSHAAALQLLDRYGVLTREMALVEGVTAGFAGVYPVLRAMEEQGQVRRGYFVAGLGAAQFATHAAVDRLRDLRRNPDSAAVLLAATDPAQPYGAVLPWPEHQGRPSRSVGARVVLSGGVPVVWLEKGARSIVTFPSAVDTPSWVDVVAEFGRTRSALEIRALDGRPVADSDWAAALRRAGFADGYRGLVLRPARG
ncbi:MAG: DEAD/DEAH box helicase [Microthrixaceae bacterium]